MRVGGDGEILLAEGGRVRLQGVTIRPAVDASESPQQSLSEAAAFVRAFAACDEGEVQLTFGAERVDRHGRWLAFVWSGDRMLNEELVRAGLASANLDYRSAGRMRRRLRDAERAARATGIGRWGQPVEGPTLATAEPPR